MTIHTGHPQEVFVELLMIKIKEYAQLEVLKRTEGKEYSEYKDWEEEQLIKIKDMENSLYLKLDSIYEQGRISLLQEQEDGMN